MSSSSVVAECQEEDRETGCGGGTISWLSGEGLDSFSVDSKNANGSVGNPEDRESSTLLRTDSCDREKRNWPSTCILVDSFGIQ